ncbi:MAG: FGGY-family carbohydrate kinase [Verrucomicrobiota bacterium]
MSLSKVYLAIDLGAGSGRVLAGKFDGHTIELEEISRFENKPVELPDGLHWNITSLYENILNGLRMAQAQYGSSIISLGVDTWGVDYALLDSEGRLLGLPYTYRDRRTDGMIDAVHSIVSEQKIFESTGLQTMFFNTIFQLFAELKSQSETLLKAQDLLFIPDLIGYWLTGNKVQEKTIVSTSQLYNPLTNLWDYSLIEKLGLPAQLFNKKITQPGSALGELRTSVSHETGLNGIKVISVCGHDTNSAVAAIPSQSDSLAYLNSGTWSLMGLELQGPAINSKSFEDNFSNEAGIDGNICFLKNICGLWLIQETRKHWLSEGNDIPYKDITFLASEAVAFKSLINPDDPSFIDGGNIPQKIEAYCHKTNQTIPRNKQEIIRCIYDSLALRYAMIWSKMVRYASNTIDTLHILGGGCQDNLLNQLTANAIGTKVVAGPIEATGLGNILVQMLADGAIASLKEGRQIIAHSSELQTYEPDLETEQWSEAKKHFKRLLKDEL